MPRQENFSAGLEFSITQSPPPLNDKADHVIEFDLRLASGRIALEGSGGSGLVEIEVPPGSYRARFSGFDFDAAFGVALRRSRRSSRPLSPRTVADGSSESTRRTQTMARL
jgi:hypothetical protein